MKKAMLAIVACVATVIIVVLGFAYDVVYGFPLILKPKTRSFVKQWESKLVTHSNLSQIQADPTTQPGDTNQIYARSFENGEWIIAKGIDGHDFSGIDATVFRDSQGSIYYQTWHHFCGFCMLTAELDGVKATNLEQFYSKLKQGRIRLKKLR